MNEHRHIQDKFEWNDRRNDTETEFCTFSVKLKDNETEGETGICK